MDRTQFAILLANKKEKTSDRGLRRANVSFVEVVFNVFFQGIYFSGGKVVNATLLYRSVRLEISSMVLWLVLGQAFRSLFTEYAMVLVKLCRDVVQVWFFYLNCKVCGVRDFGLYSKRFIILE